MQQQHRPRRGTSAEVAETEVQSGAQSVSNAELTERMRAASGEESSSSSGSFQLLGQSFGTLQEVHDWLMAQRDTPGSTVPHEPVLRVTVSPGARVAQRTQTTWNYYSPDQHLILDGQGATVTGRHNGQPTPGWFLSYRPIVESSQTQPAKANFEMRNLTVRGFESGGVEISPQAGAGAAHANDGGYAAFIEGAILEDNRFEKLGSLDTPYRRTDYAGGRFGAAGILMRGTSNSQIRDNTFQDLENGPVRGTSTGERLIHAVYARDRSCNNEISGNSFQDISGDSVRFSNASNDNVVTRNTAENAGLRTLVSEFYNSGPRRQEADSTGNRVYNNERGRAYGKSKRISRFHESHVRTD